MRARIFQKQKKGKNTRQQKQEKIKEGNGKAPVQLLMNHFSF
jgi:hypothetical protein